MEKTVLKIAVLGAESTGKTWLCQRLAQHFHTEWVPEYARSYLEGRDVESVNTNDLIQMAKGQMLLESQLSAKAQRFLFCDTTLITLKIWAELDFEAVPKEIEDGVKASRYDYFLITNNEISWEHDPLRKNLHDRDTIMDMNIVEVRKTGLPFSIVSGSGEDRLNSALLALRRFL